MSKDTGLDRFPLQGLAQNRIWCLIVALARDILAFFQILTMAGPPASRWEPRAILLRMMSIPSVITRHARRVVLRYKADHPRTTPFCLTASGTSKLYRPRRRPAPAPCPPRPRRTPLALGKARSTAR